VVIQLGAALAVLILFFNRIWPFGKRSNKHPLMRSGVFSWVKRDKIEMWIKIVIACVPDAYYGNDMTGLEGNSGATADKSALTITWTGSSSKVVLMANNGQVRMEKLSVETE
jgi:undecaprenyl pyrophosphate phosphatase UppP